MRRSCTFHEVLIFKMLLRSPNFILTFSEMKIVEGPFLFAYLGNFSVSSSCSYIICLIWGASSQHLLR